MSQNDTSSVKAKRRRTDHSSSDEESENENQMGHSDSQGSIVESSLVESSLLSAEKTQPLVGVITRVSVNNFMCHGRLEVTLGSHVNFIVGRNGSGKSAIVTAVIVGLGGKATATNRGSSIKNFIKAKKSSAWVEICLNNKGKDSYRPDVYGDKIIVRRNFSQEGASSYSISSAKGQRISTKRDELLRITDHLNIQVDNPVSILNQDTSRNFLNTKSAGDKFKFFMKATQLEQMNADYNQVQKNKEFTRQLIHSKEQTLPAMNNEVAVWENKFRNLAAVSELKAKVRSLKHEMAWAEVAQKEKDLKPREKSLRAEEAALPLFNNKVEEAKVKQEQCDAHHKELQQRLIDYSKEIKVFEPLLQAKKTELHQAKDKVAQITNELKTVDRELKITTRECQQCQDRIEELKTSASHDYEADRRQREEQIDILEKNIAELQSKKKVKLHEMEQYQSAIAKYKADAVQFEQQLKQKNFKLGEVRSAIRTLMAAKDDRLQRFGLNMKAVIEKIQVHAAQFHKVPKGPLGACFDLLDQKWALAIECCLKGLVISFVCHDHHDEKLLEEIFKSFRGGRPTIITSAFSDQIHNVSKYRARSSKFPCILDVIKSDDPVVINTLIDQRSIENVLLIEDSNEARTVMMRQPPENARECFTVVGDQAFSVPTFRYYSSDRTAVRYLMADVQDQILKLQQEEKEIEAEIRSLTQQRDTRNCEIISNQREGKKCQTQLNKIMENISSYTFEIGELRNVEDPTPVDVTTLEEEVATYNSKIQELRAKHQTIEEEKKIRDDALQIAQENYRKVEEDIRERSDSGIQLRDEISDAQLKVDNATANLKHYKNKLKEQERKIHELKIEVEKYRNDFADCRMKASEICDPIETRRSVNSIENEITQIQRRIEEEEEKQGNEVEITETYRSKKEKLEIVKREVGQLKNYIERLTDVMEKRQMAYLTMRKNIANRTKYFFLIQMFQRSFTGKMKFDFEKQTLEILVNTAQKSPSKKGVGGEAKDLKSLSGGERSFSTVCFILSLWEAMESPFRCLDEFDVFMDMVNRRISMDMMMETADMHKNMQFIFLTPQDMSSVRKISNVRIFRMPDPERTENQSALDFNPS
ncbi:hypothetical protein BsWGS_02945 [Bradybaena similaris]